MSTCRLLLLARHVVRSSLFTHLVVQDLPNCAHKILRFIECSRTNENSWNSWTIVNEEKITLNQSAKVKVLKIHEKHLEYWTRNTLVSRSIPRTCYDLYGITDKRKSLRAGTDTSSDTDSTTDMDKSFGLALGSGRNFLLKHGFGLGPDSDTRVQIYACPPSPDSFEMIFWMYHNLI